MQKNDNYEKSKVKANRLINESSPYLLQHAYNPVDWYPWGDQAFQKAKDEDKPVFLSIGYSACHWCHVMAHESFEDDEIAKIMNENFINIKVDREERPDIDDIYQRACQLLTGNGGWPLSVFLTPDQKPFYVGTYFPKHSRYGMPGLGTILNQLNEAYKTRRHEIHSAIGEFMEALCNSSTDTHISSEKITIDRSLLDEAGIGLIQMGDATYGGFGQAPKFPNPSNLLFMLRYYDIAGINRIKEFVFFTGDKMAAGGIHDHIGGGFARYSTDQRWLIPHFEKMLYDNALLTQLYAELYQISGSEKYLQIVKHTLDYVIREMTSPEGGFYSALDADSEGEEGKFYIWSKKEIIDALGDKTKSDIFCDYYGITDGGNFEGRNILNVTVSIDSLSQRYGKQHLEIERIIKDSSDRLFELREKRIRPGRDDKILTAWNGLMISGFAKGYRVTNEKKYIDCAINAINFIETKIASSANDRRLRRTYKDGMAKLNAYLEDYAFYINGLLDIFEVNSKTEYLEKAIAYTDFMLQHFWDSSEGNLFLTSDDHERLIIRTKNLYDLAVPSGNSMVAYILLKLYHLVLREDYLEKAEQIMKSAAKAASENPFGFGQLLISIYLYLKRPIEIVIIEKSASQQEQNTEPQMISWLNKQFIPNGIIARLKDDSELIKLQKFSFFKGGDSKVQKGNRPEYAFVCKNFTCSLPIYTVEELEHHIRR
jgi:uncharacterized protein